MSVCSLNYAFPHRATDFHGTFQELSSHSGAGRRLLFVLKKLEPYGCCRHLMKLTNRIAAFEKVQEIGSEGGQRPPERSYRTPYMFRISMGTLCL